MPHEHPRVLIVDDNDDVREVLAYVIGTHGYAVETARNGREALDKLRHVHPCVIILDLNMPDMTGRQFRQAQLADGDLRGIPVVVYSAAFDIREQAEQMGAAAYTEKTDVVGELLANIRQHCLK